MRFHSSEEGRSSHKSFLAFIVGVTAAVAIGGYFLFGPHGERNRKGVDRWLRRAKFEILDKMENIEDITEQQYHTIVDQVMQRYGRLRDLSQEKIERGKEGFKQRWIEMRETARRARDEAWSELDEEERQQKMSKSRSVPQSDANQSDTSRF